MRLAKRGGFTNRKRSRRFALPPQSKAGAWLIVTEGEADESAVVTDDLFHLGGPRVVRGRLADGTLAFQAVNPADGASFHLSLIHI